VTLFLALLAVGAEAATVALAGVGVAGAAVPSLQRTRRRLFEGLAHDAAWLALAVAAVATAGSLWFSYGAHFKPCTLCWYQRICMYPLVPVLAVGAWRREAGTRIVALVLAGTGLALALYHVLVERFPSLESSVCDPTNPCTIVWVRRFGYLTIPTMAASAFAFVIALVLIAHTAPDPVEDS